MRLTLLDNRLVICFLEPRAAFAEWDAVAERYTLHASLQSVHALALNLARILRVPPERVRCVTADVGGGFGSKIQPYPEYAVLAWRRAASAVRSSGRRADRRLSHRRASRDHVLAGELASMQAVASPPRGSRRRTSAPTSRRDAAVDHPNMERMVSGPTPSPRPSEARGRLHQHRADQRVSRRRRLECVYTVERLIERAARETGRDGVALRRLNMVRTFPYRTATGAIYDSGDYVARLDEALERADAARFPERREDSARRGKLRGIGVGPYVEGTGGVPREYAEVRVLPTGIVEVPIGSQSQGQGHETVFAQVVAERLGVPFDTVRIVMGDTDRVADGVGTFASRSMVRGGSAAVEASDLVVAAGKRMAAHLLEAAIADVEYRDGAFTSSGPTADRDLDAARGRRGDAACRAGATLGAAKMHENRAFAFANGCEVASSRSIRKPAKCGSTAITWSTISAWCSIR
jgi:carbon-monoxide dehydrogenase large subunit